MVDRIDCFPVLPRHHLGCALAEILTVLMAQSQSPWHMTSVYL